MVSLYHSAGKLQAKDCKKHIFDAISVLICDDTLFIKQYPELATLLESAPKAPPYTGAREWHILDIDSIALLEEVVQIITPLLPEPKPKKPKK